MAGQLFKRYSGGKTSSSTAGWEEFRRPHPARTVPNLSQPG